MNARQYRSSSFTMLDRVLNLISGSSPDHELSESPGSRRSDAPKELALRPDRPV